MWVQEKMLDKAFTAVKADNAFTASLGVVNSRRTDVLATDVLARTFWPGRFGHGRFGHLY